LEVPEEPRLGAAPGLDAPPGLQIKNTFIEGAFLLSPSLETFYRERAVHTCPSQHVGRCLSLLEELEQEMPRTPARTPLNIQTPGSIRTPLGHSLLPGLEGYELCETPCAYPSYAPHGQTGLFNALLVNAVQPPTVAQSSSPALASRHSNSESRTVLSLAEALDPQATGASAMQLVCAAPQAGLHSELPFSGFGGQDVCRLTQDSFIEKRASVLDSVPQYAAPTLEESTCTSMPPSGPALGAPELPSVGSIGHAAGRCKPCAFVHSKGCENGLACQFCHLCGPEAKKARRQERMQQRREITRAKKEKQAVQPCRSI